MEAIKTKQNWTSMKMLSDSRTDLKKVRNHCLKPLFFKVYGFIGIVLFFIHQHETHNINNLQNKYQLCSKYGRHDLYSKYANQ